MATTRTDILDIIAAAARGEYQREVLAGRAAMSGADLRGRARAFAGRYAASRAAAVRRARAALASSGWALEEDRGAHGRRHLVTVSPTGERLAI